MTRERNMTDSMMGWRRLEVLEPMATLAKIFRLYNTMANLSMTIWRTKDQKRTLVVRQAHISM